MHAIVFGMTGTRKTTLLRNIISQDLACLVGPSDARHRIPMIIFDGKGDLHLVRRLPPQRKRGGQSRRRPLR